MSATAYEYAAFISYNSADRDIARRLQRALESYSIPKALRGQPTGFGVIGERVGKVCRDRTDFKTGESLNAALIEALDKSGALVVLCSPDSARSRWVNAEVEHFQKTGRSARIFPLIARTDESRAVVNSFPPALRRADGDEPIAADLQEAGDGWHDGVLKILASILDVDFDALRQRALAAERRRARVAYGVAAGMAGLSILAVSASVIAVDQRNRSLENFEDAIIIAAKSASRINDLANQTEVPREMIHRLLTDTEADLDSLGAMESLRRHPRAQIIGAEFQLLLSDLFAEVGRASDQLASSRAADETLAAIRKSATDKTRQFFDSLLFGESNTEFYADDLEGDVAESLGKGWLNAGALERAHAEFERCRTGRQAFIEDWELEAEEEQSALEGLLSCSANAANVLSMLNRPGAAIKTLEADIDAMGAKNAASGFARLVLAQLYAENGRLAEAVGVLSGEIRLYADGATGRQQRIELAKLLEMRAKALALQGRISDAAPDLERADALLAAFLTSDGDDRRALLLRGDLLTTAGEIAAFGGERARAGDVFREGEELLTRLIRFDGARRDWRLARARLYLAKADNALRLYEADAQKTQALNSAEAASRAAIDDIDAAAVYTEDIVAQRLAVIAQVSLARILRLRGDNATAERLLGAAEKRVGAADARATPLLNLLMAAIADERGDLATVEQDYAGAKAHFDRSIALQRAFLQSEPEASLVARDLVWTSIASAKSLRAAGEPGAVRTRLAEACALKSAAALSEYSLFARDAETLTALAAGSGVRC